MPAAKTAILEKHDTNQFLKATLPPVIARGSQDLSADGLRRPLDERIIAAASKALDDGQTHYVDVPGIMPLREAVAGHLQASLGASYVPGNVIVTAGMQESRFLSMQMIGENFDATAFPAASHPGIRKALGVRERNPAALPVDAGHGCLPAVENIRTEAAKGNRLFVLESPSRLTGAAYTADEVAAIVDIIASNDCGLIWDAGLAPWVDGECAAPAALESEPTRVAVIGEAFPGAGLASWFIGYIAAPEAWIAPMQSQKQIMAICTSTAAQYAALEASALYDESQAAALNQLRALKASALSVAESGGLEIIDGAAQNILALQMDADQLAALGATGCDYGDGADYGMEGVARLTINTDTAAALSALS